MQSRIWRVWLALFGVVVSMCAHAEAPVVFEGRVREIFRARCLKCHSDDEQKSDLNLQQYATAMKGGSGGAAIIPGRPNSSPLFQSIVHAEGVEKMPPKSEKIPPEEIEAIRAWIARGAPERDGSATRSVTPLLVQPAVVKPGSVVMPAGLPKASVPARAHPVTAMAVSPWAPLIAVAGRDAVYFRGSERGDWLGQVAFGEGIPFVLRFSAEGARLLAAGGSPVKSGRAVIYDVRTGQRLAEVGDEADAVLAADLSGDGSLVAIGGSGRVVKVYEVATGREVYRVRKHTDWITAVAFSPDGTVLATGDRAGGVHLWEARTGAVALSLSEHKDAIHGLEWRSDGRLLASASEDGSLIVWDAKDGWPAVTVSGGHSMRVGSRERNGVLAVAWLEEGTFVTVGRDRRVRFWGAGGEALGASEPLDALPTRVRASGAGVWLGDERGRIFRASLGEGSVRVHSLLP
jgi:hypothetical protein